MSLRETKRSAVAGTRRGWKIVRERARNAGALVVVQGAKRWRRLQGLGRRLDHEVRAFHDTRKRLETYGREWLVEREIARTVAGSGPILVGPWLSEVGYEVLYWIPFVRWVQAQYGVKAERLIVLTRGGAATWYGDITTRSVELFDILDPQTFATRNASRAEEFGGTFKQWGRTPLDEELLTAAAGRLGLAAYSVLHPSLMYRLFQQFMLGHRPMSHLLRHTRFRPMARPARPFADLPDDYVAVKFYTAASLPESDEMRRTLQAIVLALAEQLPVVLLDTTLALDDHADYTFERAARVSSIRDRLTMRDNLAQQTAVIANARAFVGTCGSLAWIAPMLGVDTTAVLADPRFLHGHLQVGRQVYQTLGAGRFSPLDISSLGPLGLTLTAIGSGRAHPSGRTA